MSTHFTRRRFLQHSSLAIAGASVALSGTKASGRVIGSNDRINVAVAGINGRGSAHIGEYCGMQNVQIACLIDPDSRIFANKTKLVEDKGKNTPKCVQDFRRALEDDGIDAVSIATTNHWHAPMTIFACQAGKDVYVEKPCSHNVHEGRIAVEASRKYNRIVQHGTQSRSSGRWAQLAEFANDGSLGKLLISRGLCYKRRNSIGFKPFKEPPKELDWNLWLGPAKEQPYHENLVHYNWHWFWDFGNADIGNQGVHEMDKARWMCPGLTLPKRVFSLGGRFGYKDQAEVPNTQIAWFDYGPDKPIIMFEVRGLPGKAHMTQGVGNIMHFEQGDVAGQGTYFPKDEAKPAPLPKTEGKRGPGSQFGNFIHCMRTRKREEQHADILEGHYSSALIHLANISYRLGEDAPFNKQTKAIGDHKEIVETFERMQAHLRDENKINLEETTYRVGKVLDFDAATEKFIGNEQANAMLTREYRAPFVVPEKL